MGFWSGLAKGLLGAGGAIAAPFTGGASLAATLPGIIGSVGSGIAGGLQKGREAENAAAQDAASFAQREAAAKEASLMNRAGLDLSQRGFAQQSQGDAYQKALKSALAMNLQDANIQLPSRITKFNITGGLRPSAIGAEGKAAATELNKQAMLKLMSGEKFDAMPAYQGTAAPAYRKPGVLENIAGIAGLAGNTVGSLGAANDDRAMYQKYIDAIKALTAGQGSRVPFAGDAVMPEGGETA